MRRQFLEVHHRRRQVGLDGYIGQSAAGGAAQAVLGFGTAMSAFDEPTVAYVYFPSFRVPASRSFSSRSQECAVSIGDEDTACSLTYPAG